MPPIPITIVTGFLGSGKTTLILNLIPQLRRRDPAYRLGLLKNEYGSVAVDTTLAASPAVVGVRELLDGCICCNLVGRLEPALAELESASSSSPSSPSASSSPSTSPEEAKRRDGKRRPLDRIVIETSGSAFPATLALEVNRLARRSPGRYVLDGVVVVLDVENWPGYADTSYTARLQARYTDLVVLTKWEAVGERRLDDCLDRIADLDPDVPRVRSRRGLVDADVVFGLDSALARNRLLSLGTAGDGRADTGRHGHDDGHQSEVEVLSVEFRPGAAESGTTRLSTEKLAGLLAAAPRDEVYRIKAIVALDTPPRNSDPDMPLVPSADDGDGDGDGDSHLYILNWAFGRWTFTPLPQEHAAKTNTAETDLPLRMTVILARCESAKWKKKLESGGLLEASTGTGELCVKRTL